jgi:hypothetical protein
MKGANVKAKLKKIDFSIIFLLKNISLSINNFETISRAKKNI